MSQEPTRRVVNPGLTARRTAPPAMPAPDVKPRVRNLEPDIEPDIEPDTDQDDGYDETALDLPPDDEVVLVSAPAAKPKAAVAPIDPDVVELDQAYMAHGEPVTRIRFRKPTTRDIRRYGNPIIWQPNDSGAGMIIKDLNWDAIANYIVALSDPPLPPSTVDQLEWVDLDACGAAIAPFFMPRPRRKPTGTSSTR